MISQIKMLEVENRRLKKMNTAKRMKAELLKEDLGKSDLASPSSGLINLQSHGQA